MSFIIIETPNSQERKSARYPDCNGVQEKAAREWRARRTRSGPGEEWSTRTSLSNCNDYNRFQLNQKMVILNQ